MSMNPFLEMQCRTLKRRTTWINKEKKQTYSISNWPVGEAGGVTQMSEVVDVAEELVVQLREADHGDRAVLVEGPCVALQPGAEVSYMSCNLLNHHAPETELKQKL